MSCGPVLADPPYARAWKRRLDRSPTRRLQVCSPCICINAPERGALELGFTWWDSVCQLDLRIELGLVLQQLSGASDEIRVGKMRGDIMRIKPEDLPHFDAIVFGA